MKNPKIPVLSVFPIAAQEGENGFCDARSDHDRGGLDYIVLEQNAKRARSVQLRRKTDFELRILDRLATLIDRFSGSMQNNRPRVGLQSTETLLNEPRSEDVIRAGFTQVL